MKLCVIRAGGAGLIAIKHGLAYGCEVIAFEQTKVVGGLWNYTDKVGIDKYGIKIHAAMYKNLFTNLPKEVMSYPGYPFKEQELSYVASDDVLRYYEDFAEEFDLKKLVKFEHHVVRVTPIKEGWEVIVKNLPCDEYETQVFDFVLVCTGHFHSGYIPKYEGAKEYKGKQFHSHDYRKADPLQNQSVLVIGGAFSGVDIVYEAAKFAKHVTWSHHLEEKPDSSLFGENVDQKSDVKRLTETGAEFVDGSSRDFDSIIYCTGYEYKFPFMSVDCGISTEDRFIKPLYMHCLNINHPTMGIIGMPNYICPNQMFDLQVRFCLTFMTGRKPYPPKETMLIEYEADMEERRLRGMTGAKSHHMGYEIQAKYYADMARIAGVEPLKPNVDKMFSLSLENRKKEIIDFRKFKFNVIDDENVELIRLQ